MARSQYSDTIMYVDGTSGDLKPANNARISVYAPGTTTIQTIYTTRSAGATQTNPFTTGSTGSVEFWAEWGDYDIKIEDLNVPSRFGTKTIGWQSATGATGAIPFTALDAVTTRQILPIGSVIAWWRPNNTVTIPTGFASCDGSVVTSGNHDFGTGASITLPDLRNKFILGANSALADDAAATAGDAVGNAPGIRGTGASHARNIQHSHTVNNHTHTVENPLVLVSGEIYMRESNTMNGAVHTDNPTNWVWDPSGSNVQAHTNQAFERWFITSDGATPGTNNQLGSAQDIKPLYVGLLYIMKIKRN
jgi:hypothetical protein